MFKESFFAKLRVIDFYSQEIIAILFFGLFLIILYFSFSFLLRYSLKIAERINEKRKKIYNERLLTIVKAIKSIFKYILLFIFLLFILKKFNINLTVVLTSAGFLGATIVLIFQNTLRDILSGWLFFFEDLFREGEEVIINNIFAGRVIDFKSRFLTLRGMKGEIINIPYSQINTVHNLSRKRAVSKIIIKFKRGILFDDFFMKLSEILKNNLADYQNLDLIINKNFNLGEASFEALISYKSSQIIKDDVSYRIKTTILKNFSDYVLEMKNEN